MAALQTTSAGRTAPNNENLIGVLRLQTASPRRASISISLRQFRLMRGYRTLVNISGAHETSECRFRPPSFRVERRKLLCSAWFPVERGLWIAAERERSLLRRASWSL